MVREREASARQVVRRGLGLVSKFLHEGCSCVIRKERRGHKMIEIVIWRLLWLFFLNRKNPSKT